MAKKKAFSKRYIELKKMGYADIFKQFKGELNLNTKEKKHFVFPYLDDLGFDTWEKVYLEVFLISKKESKQPREVRDLLVTIYHGVTKTS